MTSLNSSGPERRQAPRTRLSLELTLSRGRGGPIRARTLDICPGGMRIATERPLGIDELLSFRLPFGEEGTLVDGRARVLREHHSSVYALRFEQIADEAAARLSDVVSSGAVASQSRRRS
jgi:hypothetical protein